MGLFKAFSDMISKSTPQNEIAQNDKTAGRDGYISVEDLPPCYNTELLKWSKRSECYLLIGANREKATADILKLNSFIDRSKELLRSFPGTHFVTNQFRFDEPKQKEYHPFCRLIVPRYTNTGKLPKFTLELSADVSEELFARVYYQKNGEIGKAEIVSWSDRCYETQLAMIDGTLDIKAIFVTNPVTGQKQKMYYL